MEYLFYVMVIPFVYFEVYSFIHAKKNIIVYRNAEKVIEDVKRTGRVDGRDINPEYLKAYMMDFCYSVWSIIGLLSSQWVFFACLFVLTFLSVVFRKKTILEASIGDNVRFDRMNSVLSILLLVLIIYNKYFHCIEVPRSLLEVLGVW